MSGLRLLLPGPTPIPGAADILPRAARPISGAADLLPPCRQYSVQVVKRDVQRSNVLGYIPSDSTSRVPAVPTAGNGGPNCGRHGRGGESRPERRVAPLSGASPSAHLVGEGKGNSLVPTIFDAVRRPRFACLLVVALLGATAAVPALADPGASASGGASAMPTRSVPYRRTATTYSPDSRPGGISSRTC